MGEVAQPSAARRLPVGDEIFLDHVAHFVRDRESAIDGLRRAGFSPTPVSIQVNPDPSGGPPRLTGTGNVTAMLSLGYTEVLFKTAETPLAQEFDAALSRYAGLHLAAFAVADAERWHGKLAANGFRLQPLIHMQRPVDNNGSPATASFSLVRLAPGQMPEGRIQLLTHRTERLVWQPRWLEHPNGALSLCRVLIAVADVPEAANRFARLTGRPAVPMLLGRSVMLDRGRIDLLDAQSFARVLPEVSIPTLPFIGAYEIAVQSLDRLRDLLQEAGLDIRQGENSLIAKFPSELGHGAWLFTQ